MSYEIYKEKTGFYVVWREVSAGGACEIQSGMEQDKNTVRHLQIDLFK